MSESPRRVNRGGASGSGRRSNQTYSSGGRPYRSTAQQSYSGDPRRSAAQQGYGGDPRRNAARQGYGSDPRRSAARQGRGGSHTHGRRHKKHIRWGRVFLSLAVVVLAVAAAGAAVMAHFAGGVLNDIRPESGAAPIEEQYKTPEAYSGEVVNVLVCGIDYEEGRTYADAQTNDGLTDMIMYVQFDVKNKKISMFQIPRNTFVGGFKLTMENGDVYRSSNANINSIMLRNATTNADGRKVGNINALAAVIYNMYKLPVDYYVTIDMDALVEMVDVMNGVDVYIPFDMDNGKGSKLPAGYHRLSGQDARFFVRNRYGEGYARADIDRLNMQRYFYQGLFKRLRSATPIDLVKLMPTVASYVTTDMDLTTIIQLAVAALSLDSSNFMLCQSPVYMDCANYGVSESNPTGYSIVVAARQENADLLNQYFRTYTGEVPASELNIPDAERGGGEPTSANVQFMSALDQDVNAAIDAGNTDIAGVEKIPAASSEPTNAPGESASVPGA